MDINLRVTVNGIGDVMLLDQKIRGTENSEWLYIGGGQQNFHPSIVICPFSVFAFGKFASIGESLPSVELTEATPLTRVNITDICKGKKVILFGVVAAFGPGCSTDHLPGFVSKSEELKKKGFHEIICVAVNDIFVVEAWAKDQGTQEKVRMLADPDGEFIKSLGLDIDIPTLGGIRSKRFTMIILNNVVKLLAVEPDVFGLSHTLVEKLFF